MLVVDLKHFLSYLSFLPLRKGQAAGWKWNLAFSLFFTVSLSLMRETEKLKSECFIR